MGAYNPDFAGILKIAWDRFFSKHERLVVIFCGSVSAWIAQNILNSTGFVGSDAGLNPMTGRIDLRLERMKAR